MGDLLELQVFRCRGCGALARVLTDGAPNPTALNVKAALAGCSCGVEADRIEVAP